MQPQAAAAAKLDLPVATLRVSHLASIDTLPLSCHNTVAAATILDLDTTLGSSSSREGQPGSMAKPGKQDEPNSGRCNTRVATAYITSRANLTGNMAEPEK